MIETADQIKFVISQVTLSSLIIHKYSTFYFIFRLFQLYSGIISEGFVVQNRCKKYNPSCLFAKQSPYLLFNLSGSKCNILKWYLFKKIGQQHFKDKI